jgi:hypothetical protein
VDFVGRGVQGGGEDSQNRPPPLPSALWRSEGSKEQHPKNEILAYVRALAQEIVQREEGALSRAGK